eukprot:gene4360-15071_t
MDLFIEAMGTPAALAPLLSLLATRSREVEHRVVRSLAKGEALGPAPSAFSSTPPAPAPAAAHPPPTPASETDDECLAHAIRNILLAWTPREQHVDVPSLRTLWDNLDKCARSLQHTWEQTGDPAAREPANALFTKGGNWSLQVALEWFHRYLPLCRVQCSTTKPPEALRPPGWTLLGALIHRPPALPPSAEGAAPSGVRPPAMEKRTHWTCHVPTPDGFAWIDSRAHPALVSPISPPDFHSPGGRKYWVWAPTPDALPALSQEGEWRTLASDLAGATGPGTGIPDTRLHTATVGELRDALVLAHDALLPLAHLSNAHHAPARAQALAHWQTHVRTPPKAAQPSSFDARKARNKKAQAARRTAMIRGLRERGLVGAAFAEAAAAAAGGAPAIPLPNNAEAAPAPAPRPAGAPPADGRRRAAPRAHPPAPGPFSQRAAPLCAGAAFARRPALRARVVAFVLPLKEGAAAAAR